jgi:hypothetical protein
MKSVEGEGDGATRPARRVWKGGVQDGLSRSRSDDPGCAGPGLCAFADATPLPRPLHTCPYLHSLSLYPLCLLVCLFSSVLLISVELTWLLTLSIGQITWNCLIYNGGGVEPLAKTGTQLCFASLCPTSCSSSADPASWPE